MNESPQGDILQVESPEIDGTSENEEILYDKAMIVIQIQMDLDKNAITTYQPSNINISQTNLVDQPT